MKATGIVRRIDDLGRVVIPKEIRRNLRVREGDPLEIFTEGDAVCFKKYSAMDGFQSTAQPVINALGCALSRPVVLVDRFGEIVCHSLRKTFEQRSFHELEEYLDNGGYQRVDVAIDKDFVCTYIASISVEGELLGFILVFNQKDNAERDESFDFVQMACHTLQGLLMT